MKQQKLSMILSFTAAICFAFSSVGLFLSNNFKPAIIYLFLAAAWLFLALKKLKEIKNR